MNNITTHDWATTRLLTTELPEIGARSSCAYQPRLFLPQNPDRTLELGLRTQGLFKRSLPGKPLVSVVTVVLNGQAHLEQTIRSVLDQTYDNVEYILVDGGSMDSTLDIIQRFAQGVDYCVSEPDLGISDSFNKGVSLARGELVGILNADDWYEDRAAELSAAQLDRNPGFSFGVCTYHKSDGTPVTLRPDPNYGRKIRLIMPDIHHPTVFVRRAAYERSGLFDVDLKLAMDYELLLRLHKAGATGLAIPEKIAHMRMEGASNTRYFSVRKEVRAVSRRYGASWLTSNAVYWGLLLKYVLHSRKRWKGKGGNG